MRAENDVYRHALPPAGAAGAFSRATAVLDYVQQHEQVWVCTRQQIADHWREVHPFLK